MTRHEDGVILINILAILALASVAVLVMIEVQDSAITSTRRFDEAAQALAIVRGAELTAIAALRRDLEAGSVDHPGDEWGQIGEVDAAIEGGTFSLEVVDAQDRFNLNNLANREARSPLFRRIAAVAGIDPELRARIENGLRVTGMLSDVASLRRFGASDEDIEALRRFVTTLPASTRINLNSADRSVLTLLFDDAVLARLLEERRAVEPLSRSRLRDMRIVVPFDAGFSSDYFVISASARTGSVTQGTESLAFRDRSLAGAPVRILRRQRKSGDLPS